MESAWAIHVNKSLKVRTGPTSVRWPMSAKLLPIMKCLQGCEQTKEGYQVHEKKFWFLFKHYCGVIMSAMASQITGVSSVNSIVCSGADRRKHPKLRVTGLCEGNSPVTGEFPSQRASNAENVFIWWRHHESISPENIRGSKERRRMSIVWWI